jgi:hypothetical protein
MLVVVRWTGVSMATLVIEDHKKQQRTPGDSELLQP